MRTAVGSSLHQNELEEATGETHQEADERMHRLAALGMAAGGLLHDVSNLLWPMRARLERLASQRLGPAADEDLAAVASCVDYLAVLARAARSLMTHHNGLNGHIDATQLRQWWRQVRGLVASAVPRGVNIACDLDESDFAVRIAPIALTQSVVNLVHNAGKALAGRQNAQISLSASCQVERVALIVRDNGPGLCRQSTVPRATSLWSGDDNAARGFGLSLVRSILAQAGGELREDSSPGAGAAFVLLLPLAGSTTRSGVTDTCPTM
jgi:two-component system C4-dicarboxylate transport sensor histidine kinase DctB